MKIIYFFVLSVLGSTLSNAMDSKELDSIIESLTPQRTQPHSVVNRPQENFHEYYLSGAGLSCGFRIFGLERKEGIELIRSNLNSNTVKKFVSNSILREEGNNFKEIYHQEKNEVPNLKEFSQNDDNRKIYLKFYAEEARALPLEMNRFRNGNAIPNSEETFGILDALPHIQQKNLYVYVRDDPSSSLILMHTFYSDKERLYFKTY